MIGPISRLFHRMKSTTGAKIKSSLGSFLGHRVRGEMPMPMPMPPKGCLPVRVGAEGEEQRRFVVPVAYLAHPLFAELLEAAAAEYGYEYGREGTIAIPCGVEKFRHVHDVIHRETCGAPAAALYHHHNRVSHLVACFGA